MKSRHLALAAFLAILPACRTGADTLIGTFAFGSGHWDTLPNGGFEAGTLAGWAALSTTPSAFSATGAEPLAGAYSAQVSTGSALSGSGISLNLATTVSVQEGQSYVLSGFIRRSAGSTASMSFDLNDAPFEVQPSSATGTDGTQFVWGTFTAPADAEVTVRFVLDGNATAGDLATVDEVAVTPLAQFAPPTLAVPELPATPFVAGGILLGVALWRRR